MNSAAVSKDHPFTWKLTYQWVLALVVICVLAGLTYGREGWVPILSRADLGIHEFGHLLFWWAPELMVQLAGTMVQLGVPLLLGGYFLWRRDRLAAVLMLAWMAEALNNISVYMYDATRMDLILVGDDGSGAGHDWHNVFTRLGVLEHTDAIAYTTRGLSAALFLAAAGLSICWWVRGLRERGAARWAPTDG